ncbi:transcriptional regulator YdeO [Escherichia coli]
MKKKIESYQGAAGGWGAVKSVANAVRKQMDIRQDIIAMFDMNKPEGFDCPGCAWPDPKHSASFDICENGAKAIAWEVTDKQVNASFFAENTVQSLLTWGDHELEAAGRLTQPLKYDAVSDCYKPLSWQQAFDEIGARLQSYSDPNQVEFYTSGRTSNEAAFLYQLFAREYGSNNFPDCSNMCHEPTSVGLAASIGVGKGTVLLEDFEKCDLVICIGHNPGTNHPRMLTSLRALVKRGAKMVAINPLQERGLERFTAPQNPFEINAVRTHFEPYERHFKEIGFNENTIKKYLQCTNIQTVTVPVPAKFLRASNVPTGLLNEMIAYLNSEERNHHNFSELLLFSCLSIFATCKGFITLLTNGVLSVSGKVRNIVNMKLAHPWKLKDICDCLYISESLLKKKLKQEQTTFSQILLDARMQHAKNLIRVEGSVNKIAEQCGYASTSYFIYAFRKHFGNSPKRVSKEYRCQRHTGMNTGNTMNALAI